MAFHSYKSVRPNLNEVFKKSAVLNENPFGHPTIDSLSERPPSQQEKGTHSLHEEQSIEGSSASPSADVNKEQHHMHGVKLHLLIFGLSLAVLLMSLDMSIITTAIPIITEKLQSTADIGWYMSACMLTLCAIQRRLGCVLGARSGRILGGREVSASGRVGRRWSLGYGGWGLDVRGVGIEERFYACMPQVCRNHLFVRHNLVA